MRGSDSYGRRRDLLAAMRLEEFKAWVQTEGWTIEPTPPQAVYECLRIRKDREQHIFFLRIANHSGIPDPHTQSATHVTVPKGAVNLVRKFIITT